MSGSNGNGNGAGRLEELELERLAVVELEQREAHLWRRGRFEDWQRAERELKAARARVAELELDDAGVVARQIAEAGL